jgi:hypothetical protein
LIAINTLHHLPLADAGLRLATAIVPQGKVLIADLFAARGLLELPYNGLSWLLRSARNSSPETAAAWAAHGVHDELLAIGDVRRALRSVMPGIAMRRHLGWRYTAIWQRT